MFFAFCFSTKYFFGICSIYICFIIALDGTSRELQARVDQILEVTEGFADEAKVYVGEMVNSCKFDEIKNTGGNAGGKLAVRNGIFYKIIDSEGIYGSVDNAMKSASNELRGANTILNMNIANLTPMYVAKAGCDNPNHFFF